MWILSQLNMTMWSQTSCMIFSKFKTWILSNNSSMLLPFMCITNVKINHKRHNIHSHMIFFPIYVKSKWISNLPPSCDLINAHVFDGQLGYSIIDIHLHYLNWMHGVEVVGFNFTCTTYSIDVIWLDELVWCNMNYLW